MIKFLSCITLLLLAVPDACYADITTGLLAWYTLDEGSGNTANDSSGNGNTGSLQNAPSWNKGKIGRALSLNGTTQYVGVVNDVLNTPTAISVTAWINPSVLNNCPSHCFYVSNRTAANHGWSVGFVQGSSPTKIDFTIQSVLDYASTVSALVVNKWQFVVCTWDNVSNKVTFYYNGLPLGSQVAAGVMTTGTQLVLGAQGPSGGAINEFEGSLDDIRIYNRVLSASDVVELYNKRPIAVRLSSAHLVNFSTGN